MRFHPAGFVGALFGLGVAASSACGTTESARCSAGVACIGTNQCTGTLTCSASGVAECGCSPIDSGVQDVVADSVPPTPDASDWSPKDLAGLVLWLDDSKGVVMDSQAPTHVAKWLDQSGNANDATAMNSQPTVTANGANGRPAVVCSTQGFLQVDDAPSLQFGTGDYTIAMVVALNQNTTPDDEPLWDKGGIVRGLVAKQKQAFSFRDYQTTIELPFAKQGFQLVVMQGKQMRLDVGSMSLLGQNNGGDVSAAQSHVVLCPPAGVFSPPPAFAEVVAVKGTVSATELNSLKTYLQTKFGL